MSRHKSDKRVRNKTRRRERAKKFRKKYPPSTPHLLQDLHKQIAPLDPISSVACIAGILTCPELGANACRLEALVREVLQHARGDVKLTDKVFTKLFAKMNAMGPGLMEDPAEDIFVSLVWDRANDYRIFEGIYEGNTFYLQRFLDCLNEMPCEEAFETLRRNVHALLVISEAIAERSHIQRYTQGAELPLKAVPERVVSRLGSFANRVCFTSADLNDLGISLSDLRPFCSTLKDWQNLHADTQSVPNLERMPLLKHNGALYVLIPSCISPAIRWHIVSFCNQREILDQLHAAIARSYTLLFRESLLLGQLKDCSISWIKREGLLISDCVTEIDAGRFIHFLFIVDDFQDAVETGLGNSCKAMSTANNLLDKHIAYINREFSDHPTFREGITLVVACGWGRAVSFSLPSKEHLDWRLEFISAEQLLTLSLVNGMDSLTLLRLLDHVAALKSADVELFNINGLLNLYAWAEQSNYELFPHGLVKHGDTQGPNPLQIMITQNGLLSIRAKVAKDHDMHIARMPNDQFLRVRRYTAETYFEEDVRQPLYVSFDDILQDELKSVYEGKCLSVWLTVSVGNTDDRGHLFTLWDAFSKWLLIIVPTIEAELTSDLCGNIHWHLSFPSHDPALTPISDTSATIDSLTALMIAEVDRKSSYLCVQVPPSVYEQFYRPDNCAEKAILRVLVRGTSTLLQCRLDDKKVIEASVPNSGTKQIHLFTAQNFDDYVSEGLPSKPLMLEEFDKSLSQLGLAWRVLDGAGCSDITGVKECTKFLNKVVDEIWQDIKRELYSHDKQQMVMMLLKNVVVLRRNNRSWNRTTRALLALHANSSDAGRRIADEKFKHNESAISSRILLEMALCECKGLCESQPGQLDIARLLSKVSVMIQIGGWSDGIAEGAIPAKVKISAIGKIHVNHDFYEQVMMPFGYEIAQQQQSQVAEQYDQLFEEPRAVPSTAHLFEEEFQKAWVEEHGFTVDQGRRYMDDIEDYAIKSKQPIVVLRRSELVMLRSKELAKDIVERLLVELTLVARDCWETVSTGFTMKDVEPWRYRRRLSAVYRPIFQLEEGDDPLCIIAPSFIRGSFAYRLDCTYRAKFDESHFKSQKMKRWIGVRRNEMGHRFNREVACKLKTCEWQCEVEVTPAAIGISTNGKDYGDIDVLAWHIEKRRIIAIECKDIMFAKTSGEVARQLREFRGETNAKNKPDRLRRHLDRINLLRSEQSLVEQFTGLVGVPIESALVFRNVGPIQFVETKNLKQTQIVFFSELAQL